MEAEPIKYIDANNLRFGYFEQGQGPLVLCLHGFPDTAHTWQHLMPSLAQAGYRAVAPFMRGYPPTAAPVDQDYSALQLGTDVAGLIQALGESEAIVVGQDWGALSAYAAANAYPDMISKMVTVAIPHPRTIRLSLKTARRAQHFITFQFRRWAEWRLTRDHCAYVDTIYRRWSPTWQFTPADTEPVKSTLALPGAAKAALGYYWSFAANRNNRDMQKTLTQKTSVPTLCLIGARDGALDAEVMSQTPPAFTGPYSYQILPGVGHFLHREVPEDFAAIVLDYLAGPAT